MGRDLWQEIQNSEGLLQRLGTWPSFHDAEVMKLSLNRDGPDGPILSLDVYVFVGTNAVTPSGEFDRDQEVVVVLTFFEVADLQLQDFNRQNVLSSVDIQREAATVEARRRVVLRGLYGINGEFTCSRIVLQSVGPFGGG